MQALAEFMEEIRGNKVRLKSENLVLTAGATSANETLMFCLADPGNAFLLPTPYYPGYVFLKLPRLILEVVIRRHTYSFTL